ncbi:MAG: hypothetical protein ACNS63_03915 [Candidatus Nitrospinota bacterium M3_3B_026]
MRRHVIAAAFVISFALPGAALADDVTDQVDEALKAYKKKDYSTAAAALDAAATLVRQKRADVIGGLLPKPLSGWEAGEAKTSQAGAAMFGGGISAERRYRKDGKEITVSFTTDSPMLQAMSMMFANPQFSGPDNKLVVIGGQKAIYNSKDNSYQAMVASKVLVSVEGKGADKASVESYFKAVDFEKLVETVK